MLQPSNRLSPLTRSACRALIASLSSEPIPDLRGTAVCKIRGGGRFWYDSYRIGARVRTHYLGPDSPDLQEKLRVHAEQRQAFAVRQQERRHLVRFLQAERLAAVDSGTGSFLSAFAALGGFRHGAVLIGRTAFELYGLELGCRLGMTSEAGFLRSGLSHILLAALEPVSDRLGQITAELKLRYLQPYDPLWPMAWPSGTRDVRVNCLRSETRTSDTLPWPVTTDAQSLPPLLTFLLAQAIPSALPYRTGVLVRIPRPERFAIHALLMALCHAAADRPERAATELDQATALLTVLVRDRPDDLRAAWAIASARWPDMMQASLAQAPHVESLLRETTI